MGVRVWPSTDRTDMPLSSIYISNNFLQCLCVTGNCGFSYRGWCLFLTSLSQLQYHQTAGGGFEVRRDFKVGLALEDSPPLKSVILFCSFNFSVPTEFKYNLLADPVQSLSCYNPLYPNPAWQGFCIWLHLKGRGVLRVTMQKGRFGHGWGSNEMWMTSQTDRDSNAITIQWA